MTQGQRVWEQKAQGLGLPDGPGGVTEGGPVSPSLKVESQRAHARHGLPSPTLGKDHDTEKITPSKRTRYNPGGGGNWFMGFFFFGGKIHITQNFVYVF